MLVLKRRDGQWVNIVHASGDVLRIRVQQVGIDGQGRVNLVFDDDAFRFTIERPERIVVADVPSRALADRLAELQKRNAV